MASVPDPKTRHMQVLHIDSLFNPVLIMCVLVSVLTSMELPAHCCVVIQHVSVCV